MRGADTFYDALPKYRSRAAPLFRKDATARAHRRYGPGWKQVASTPSTQTHSTVSPWEPRAITTLLVQPGDGRVRPITSTDSTMTSTASPARTHQNVFTDPLEGSEEGHEVLLLRRGQLRSEHEVEELHRVVEGEEPSVVQVRR
jgi:hypothetical protein